MTSYKALACLATRLAELSSRLAIGDGSFRQAVDYLLLVASHPAPPNNVVVVAGLIRCAFSGRKSPATRAKSLREAAWRICKPVTLSRLQSACDLLLHELALAYDDGPAERLEMIGAYARHWSLPFDLESISPPSLLPLNAGPQGAHIDHQRAFSPHVMALCSMAVDARIHPRRARRLSQQDWHACMQGLRLAYGSLYEKMGSRSADNAEALTTDFHDFGEEIWDWLCAVLVDQGQSIGGLDAQEWCSKAKQMLLLRMAGSKGRGPGLGATLGLPKHGRPDHAQSVESSTLTLQVCLSPIVPSTDRYDGEELKRYSVLEQPLPVVPMPSPDALRACLARLVAEFPWAGVALDEYLGELIGMANLGVRRLRAPPTLFVGRPGAGKTRLAMRLAEELGLPPLIVPAGGQGDAKVLSGTARGWASGRPGEVVAFIARTGCASPAVVIDELDKAGAHTVNDRGLQPYLLGLLEPQTAARHRDAYLLTECDLTGVTWLATANSLAGLGEAMLSRLRILFVPQPHKSHYPSIARGVVADLAKEWGLPLATFPELEGIYEDMARLDSARAVRRKTTQEIARWARRIIRH